MHSAVQFAVDLAAKGTDTIRQVVMMLCLISVFAYVFAATTGTQKGYVAVLNHSLAYAVYRAIIIMSPLKHLTITCQWSFWV